MPAIPEWFVRLSRSSRSDEIFAVEFESNLCYIRLCSKEKYYYIMHCMRTSDIGKDGIDSDLSLIFFQ